MNTSTRATATFALALALTLGWTLPLVAQTPVATADTDAAPDDIVAVWEADRTVPLEAEGLDLDDFRYVARPVVVFADSPRDPLFIEQMALLADGPDRLAERDVVVIFDTDPDGAGDVRLDLRPRGFMLALVGKDGQIEARKIRPWDVRELTRSIDRTPSRIQEVRDRRGTN
ncbi:DUF4174 domain-containing protein [Loktanella fryxellensis]|nr:DUF4174 domain-containing protein [Loktanella fryxellensis]